MFNDINKLDIPDANLNLMHVSAFYDSLECLVLLHQDYQQPIDILSPVFNCFSYSGIFNFNILLFSSSLCML